MTVLGYVVFAGCLLFVGTCAVLAVREVWRDCVRARRGLDRETLP